MNDWRERAVCVLETPDAPELWTPDRRPVRAVLVHLEAMCNRCPVSRDCAVHAVGEDGAEGVYAGVWVPRKGRRVARATAIRRLKRIIGEPTGDIVDEAVEVPA
ncbi:WhiB family transcriptional regulator [Mycobacterium intracellulare]|uniref:WhiB family transcriptional regulator n=1 Tax=Mycobacterium intracellulare TaxID=1767 RepID=UPI001EEE50BE|nr:WhiB family transcriptional regulator [Mycobacterium intracellulare]MEE3755247.1 WhiB family transcriptional regulator [Mycobacterium intracellulare]